MSLDDGFPLLRGGGCARGDTVVMWQRSIGAICQFCTWSNPLEAGDLGLLAEMTDALLVA